MLRPIGKTCFAAAYTLLQGARRFATPEKQETRSPFIICYHRVVEDFDHSSKHTIPSMLVSTAMLERHVDWLARRFEIVSLDDIGAHLHTDRRLRRPQAAITFDDGYGDVYHHAFPLLRRKGVPFSAFVVTGLIGTGRPQIFDRLYCQLRTIASRGIHPATAATNALRSIGVIAPAFNPPGVLTADESFQVMTTLLKTLPAVTIDQLISTLERNSSCGPELLRDCLPMTWEMIETMHRNGVTIGSHTKSHTLLTSETLDSVQKELTESKQILETNLGAEIGHFAYPDGRFNSPTVQAVRAAGYRFAYSICRRADRLFPSLTIPRKVLWERSCINAVGRFSSSIMNCQANWVFDAKDRCEHDHSARDVKDTNAALN
jgi:peptidoglycan/xylan/chitin deacetylase (PgdA/CDA1 family)